ncbi:hypothetical protein NPIL_512511 [Nephila pilipes]|uniref:Uncharacterized protein n=1 Tax=Nephila pilipes TaxID=299642 RepID=A0A8X6UQL1_NEPPI|nr:hypothetical protein NPIL_512511 [Nephila pilipes]
MVVVTYANHKHHTCSIGERYGVIGGQKSIWVSCRSCLGMHTERSGFIRLAPRCQSANNSPALYGNIKSVLHLPQNVTGGDLWYLQHKPADSSFNEY